MKKEHVIGKWLYWFLFAVAVIFVYKTLDNFTDITNWFKNLFSLLSPFILAIIISYLFYVPCKKIEGLYKKIDFKFIKKHSRAFSIFTVYVIALLVIILVINVILPIVSKSLIELASNIPLYYNNLSKFIQTLPEDSWLKSLNLEEVLIGIQSFDISNLLSVDNMLNYIKGALGIVGALFNIFVTVVVSFYILLERAEIVRFLKRLSNSLFKEQTSQTLGYYFKKVNEIFFTFISSQIFDGFIVGIILSVAMLIMNVKYAILLGFMIGLFNIIPYFGAIVASIIAIIITIFTGGPVQAIWMSVIIIILQQIDANIINPRILGNSLSLSPILVIFSVTVGGAYFGILGMFLAVPIVTAIKVLLNDFITLKETQKNISE